MKFGQRGASNLDGILIIFVIIFILIISPKDGSSGSSFSNSSSGGSFLSSYGVSNTENRGGNSQSANNSSISIGSGNASYAYQSYEEYVTIDNNGREEINITGWQLKNGKDERTYYLGGQLQRFSADIAIIPRATLSLSPSGNSITQDIVLKSGEKAIVTTGSINVRTPYVITSFKENMCTGYLDAMPEYTFTPSLSRNCPRPANEAGLENLDNQCRTFVRSLSSCETPEFGGLDRRTGKTCPQCVNGEPVSGACAAFIKERFNYQGCVAYHSNDENFSGRTWRVFLGRGWEMWADDYETIELFDRFGQLVNFKNY